MEHKLSGGEYLPLARSRAKAMRAAGIAYGTQRLIVGGKQVEVRLSGEHEYFRVLGDSFEVFSGVVDGASYDPTLQAWVKLQKSRIGGGPGTFTSEPRVNAADEICATMYSGRMTKVVQLYLGWEVAANRPNNYGYSWSLCHGACVAADGATWLVQISSAGVFARVLPVVPVGTQKNQDVAIEAVALFGGFPNGVTFPTGAALDASVADGTVRQLLSAGAVSDVFSKRSFVDTMGWSFNTAGTEAHITCWEYELGRPPTTTELPVFVFYHYRIDIDVTAGSAAVTLVESGRHWGMVGAFGFSSGSSYTWGVPHPDPLLRYFPSAAVEGDSAPVFVCHLDGVLEVVRIESKNRYDLFVRTYRDPHATLVRALADPGPGYVTYLSGDPENKYETTADAHVTCSAFPSVGAFSSITGNFTERNNDILSFYITAEELVPYNGDHIQSWSRVGFSLAGCRDGFAIRPEMSVPVGSLIVAVPGETLYQGVYLWEDIPRGSMYTGVSVDEDITVFLPVGGPITITNHFLDRTLLDVARKEMTDSENPSIVFRQSAVGPTAHSLISNSTHTGDQTKTYVGPLLAGGSTDVYTFIGYI